MVNSDLMTKNDQRHSFSEARFLEIKQELLRNGSAACRVMSGSMVPVLRVGDEFAVEPLDRDPRPFEIIVFLQNQTLICHCFVKFSELGGDAPNRILLTHPLDGSSFDFPVDEKNVLGVVTSHRVPWWRKIGIVLKAKKPLRDTFC